MEIFALFQLDALFTRRSLPLFHDDDVDAGASSTILIDLKADDFLDALDVEVNPIESIWFFRKFYDYSIKKFN